MFHSQMFWGVMEPSSIVRNTIPIEIKIETKTYIKLIYFHHEPRVRAERAPCIPTSFNIFNSNSIRKSSGEFSSINCCCCCCCACCTSYVRPCKLTIDTTSPVAVVERGLSAVRGGRECVQRCQFSQSKLKISKMIHAKLMPYLC